MADPTLVAAAISSIVALIGVAASLIVARWQARSSSEALELKSKGLELQLSELRSRVEQQRQEQLSEVLKRRLEVYPKLWACLLEFTLNWEADQPDNNSRRDGAWARAFLRKLDACHAECGALFSEQVYRSFHQFRNEVKRAARQLGDGDCMPPDEYRRLYRLVTGERENPGLASFMKDDLGSYRPVAIQRSQRAYVSSSRNREPDSDESAAKG